MHNLTHSGSVEPVAEITIAEAVAIAGRDRSTIIRWIGAGKLRPTRKLPGRTGTYLLDRSEVERIAAEAVAS
jgi:predicted site-specific integrase-resolvase